MSKKTQCLSSGTYRARIEEQVRIVAELRHKYPLKDLLNFFNIPRSTFYYHLSNKKDKYVKEKDLIVKIYNDNYGAYGYRRITSALRASTVLIINHKTVHKLMKELGLKGKIRRSRYKSYRGEIGKVAPNILDRKFNADAPYEKLVTDVTEFNVCDTKVYLSPVMDLFNNEILSYNISLHPNFTQTKNMLYELFKILPENSHPILHSDQGWQYQIKAYQNLLKEHNIKQSMSRKGNCYDNCCMENFFGRLKVEMFFGEKFKSVNAFIDALNKYIKYYNCDRISLKIKGMSPVQYRNSFQSI